MTKKFEESRQDDNFGAAGSEFEDQFCVVWRHSQTTASLKRTKLIFGLKSLAIFDWNLVKPDVATGWPKRKACHVDEPNTFEI